MIAIYNQINHYTKKNGEVSTYHCTLKRNITGRRLTKAQIKEIEPVILSVIDASGPDASLKKIHKIVSEKIPYKCSETLIYRYMKN
jgi:hypothetical protein